MEGQVDTYTHPEGTTRIVDGHRAERVWAAELSTITDGWDQEEGEADWVDQGERDGDGENRTVYLKKGGCWKCALSN